MKSAKYLKFIRSLPCSHCKTDHSEAHHIIGIDGIGIMGSKQSDIHTMPLCRECHIFVHKSPATWPQTKWMMDAQKQAISEGVLEVINEFIKNIDGDSNE